MSSFAVYKLVVLGVGMSVLLPLLRSLLPKPTGDRYFSKAFWSTWWGRARPYVATALFSVLAGVLIVAFMGDKLTTWQSAILAGYAVDSTLEKISTGNQNAD